MASRVTTKNISQTTDQRTAITGNIGEMVSPGAALGAGGGGAIVATGSSSVRQSIDMVGLQGDAVRAILDDFQQGVETERQQFFSLAGSMSDSLGLQAQQLGQALTATRAPEIAQLQIAGPLVLLVLLILLMLWGD